MKQLALRSLTTPLTAAVGLMGSIHGFAASKEIPSTKPAELAHPEETKKAPPLSLGTFTIGGALFSQSGGTLQATADLGWKPEWKMNDRVTWMAHAFVTPTKDANNSIMVLSSLLAGADFFVLPNWFAGAAVGGQTWISQGTRLMAEGHTGYQFSTERGGFLGRIKQVGASYSYLMNSENPTHQIRVTATFRVF